VSIEFRPNQAGAGPRITGFAEGGFRIDGATYRAALLTPERVAAWDEPELTVAALESVLSIDPAPEFVLIGTGADMVRPPVTFVKAIEARGIGVEAMDSRAAARAWGVLRSEDRWIVAALLPLS
jgi:uncharacterized protein